MFDAEYNNFKKAQQLYYSSFSDVKHLFEVDLGNVDLFSYFERHLKPRGAFQLYNCDCCKAFVRKFGHLVAIRGDGSLDPVMWPLLIDRSYGPFADISRDIRLLLRNVPIKGPHYSSEEIWGTPANTPKGGPYKGKTWTHFSVVPLHAHVTRQDKYAEKVEDHRMLREAVLASNLVECDKALEMLKYMNLSRSEKFDERMGWFRELVADAGNRGLNLANHLWPKVMDAPKGWAHMRSSVLWSLLEDIRADKPESVIRENFNQKLDPMKYQRPTAPLTMGRAAAADKLIEKMGLAPALHRRYAKVEELQPIWSPSKAPDGIFRNMVYEKRRERVPMTWNKFQAMVLQDAARISILTPTTGDYFGMLAPAVPGAPKLLRWDNEINFFLRNGGSDRYSWNLRSLFANVSAIAYHPSTWDGNGFRNDTQKYVFFVLDGCHPTRDLISGSGLFLEHLRSDLHEVRHAIAEYDRRNQPEGREQATACGFLFAGNDVQRYLGAGLGLEVTLKSGKKLEIALDRFE